LKLGKNIAALTAVLVLCGCSSVKTSGVKGNMLSKAIVPMGQYHNVDVKSSDLLEIHQKYGIENFFICGPGVSVRVVGYPGVDAYETIAAKINRLKKELADTPIKLHWWSAPFFKLGFNSKHQHIVGINGNVSPIGICALDENFRKESCRNFALIAQKTRLPLILIEDDYSLQNHTNAAFGCFCPLHLEAFAKKAGRFYSREELQKIYKEDKNETLELRRLFAECAKDSLVSLASELRAAVDKVSPETRIGLCETLNTDADGFAAIDIARALAGKNTRPLMRLRCAWYTSYDAPQMMPDYLSHTLYTAERLSKDIEFIIEADTYPHTTYFGSPELLKANIGNALAMGADNVLLYAAQYLDDPAEDPAYFEMFKRSDKFFDAVSALGNSGKMEGVKIIYDPLAHSAKKLSRDGRITIVHTSAALARMGIPFSTVNGKPDILIGQNAAVLSDAEITRILSGGVLLDAEAAEILEKRGYGELIGVSVKPVEKYLFVGEKICDLPIFEGIKGRFIYNLAFAPAGSENAVQYKKPVPRKGAEVLSYFIDPQENFMQPGMVRFTNKLGGRVCILASTMTFNRTANLFNLRKVEMLRRVLEWLKQGELPAAVSRTPNCWLKVRKLDDATIIFITNLSTAPRKEIPIHLAKELQGKPVKELCGNGRWKKVEVKKTADGAYIFKGVTKPVQMRVFKVEE